MTNVYLSDSCLSENAIRNHAGLTGIVILNFHAPQCVCKKCVLLPLLEKLN